MLRGLCEKSCDCQCETYTAVMTQTREALRRYSRQIILPEIAPQGFAGLGHHRSVRLALAVATFFAQTA